MADRPYQVECTEAIVQRYAEGVNRQLVVLSTGTGKTVVFSKLPDALNLSKRMLVIADGDELVEQSAEKLATYNPGRSVDIEKAESWADPNAQIIAASLKSLTDKRLARFDPAQFGLIVLDEAHLSVAPTWRKVLNHLHVAKGEQDDSPALLLGFTATSHRHDNIGLEYNYDEIVYTKPLVETIKEKWLVPPTALRVETGIDLSQLRPRKGDFTLEALERAVNVKARNRLVVSKYRTFGMGQPFLAFTVDVQHSHDLAAEFTEAGYKVAAIWGNMPKTARRAAIALFKAGELDGLLSCQALLTGFDAPNATVGLMCRPTLSALLFTQMCGRLLRPDPSPEQLRALAASGRRPAHIKRKAILIDFVDVTRHSIKTVPALFGLPPEFNLRGESPVDVLDELADLEGKARTLDLSAFSDILDLRIAVQSVDMLAPPVIPPEALKHSRFAWQKQIDGVYILRVPSGNTLSIRENTLGQFEVRLHARGVATTKYTVPKLATAFEYADAEVPLDDRKLLESKRGWRKEEATGKQLRKLWVESAEIQQRFEGNYDKYLDYAKMHLSRGQVSDLINQTLTAQEATL